MRRAVYSLSGGVALTLLVSACVEDATSGRVDAGTDAGLEVSTTGHNSVATDLATEPTGDRPDATTNERGPSNTSMPGNNSSTSSDTAPSSQAAHQSGPTSSTSDDTTSDYGASDFGASSTAHDEGASNATFAELTLSTDGAASGVEGTTTMVDTSGPPAASEGHTPTGETPPSAEPSDAGSGVSTTGHYPVATEPSVAPTGEGPGATRSTTSDAAFIATSTELTVPTHGVTSGVDGTATTVDTSGQAPVSEGYTPIGETPPSAEPSDAGLGVSTTGHYPVATEPSAEPTGEGPDATTNERGPTNTSMFGNNSALSEDAALPSQTGDRSGPIISTSDVLDTTGDATPVDTSGPPAASEGHAVGETLPSAESADASVSFETTSSPVGSSDSTQSAPIDGAQCEELPFPRANRDDVGTYPPRPDYDLFSGEGTSRLYYVSAGTTGGAHALAWGDGGNDYTPHLHTWDAAGELTHELALTRYAILNGIDRNGNVFTSAGSMFEPWRVYKQAASGEVIWDFVDGYMAPLGLYSFGGRHYLSAARAWDYQRIYETATLIALDDSGQKLWENGVDLESTVSSGTVSATCDYVAMSGNVAPYADPSTDMAVSLYKSNGELLWQAQLLTQAELLDGPSSDILVDVDGTVVIAGRYRQAAFLQKRDVTGDVVWHRTFEELPAWKTIAWTGEGTFMAAGVDTAREAVVVREFDLNGADRWSRTVDNLAGAGLSDSDVDENGDIYLVGWSDAGGLLVRVNASQLTDIADPPDGGIPGLQYSDPDLEYTDPYEGLQQSTSGQWCKEPVSVVEVVGVLAGLDRSQPATDRVILDTFEYYTLCPGETQQQCVVGEGGEVNPNLAMPATPTVWTSGCAAVADGGMGPLYGCCLGSDFELLKVRTCTPDLEGRRCQTLNDEPCYTEGACADSECVPTVPRECDDGRYCNGAEWCDDAYGCRTTFSPAFDDDPATIDLCDEATDTVSHEPATETPELCAEPLEVLGGSVADHLYDLWVYPRTLNAALACGEGNHDCRRTDNGEWYASNHRGDPLSLPVSSGCSERVWTDFALAMGNPYVHHHLDRCCVGEAPFVDGEPLGNSIIKLLP